MKIVAHSDTAEQEVVTKHFRSLVRPYFGAVLKTYHGPQAFLVDMPDKGSTIAPHFHDVDQFQVIVRGGGRLGPGPAKPVAFHYADAYTPYGPIIGADDGIAFFTLRVACADGYYPMPESRGKLKAKPGRNLAGQFDIDNPLPPINESTRQRLLESKPDNMLVVGISMGPNSTASGEPADAGDQYYLVCRGTLIHERRELPPMTLIRLEHGEPTPSFTAGSKGAAMLLLQLPLPSERIGSDPRKLAERPLGDYAMPQGMLEQSSAR